MKRPGGFDGADLDAWPEAEPDQSGLVARRARGRSARREAVDSSAVEAGAADFSAVEVGDAAVDDVASNDVASNDVAGGDLVDGDLAATVPLGRARDGLLPWRRAADGSEGTGLSGPHALEVEEEIRVDPVRRAERELKRAQRSVRARERRERRRFTAHIRRRRRVWAIGVSAVLGLALFVAIGLLSPMTAVREVRVLGAQQVNSADLQAALQRFEGTPLALVDEQEVHRALEPFPLIQRYAIERIPPHTLVVRIEERNAVIAAEGDGVFSLFDPAGVLIGAPAERPAGVPLAVGSVTDTSSPAFDAAGRVIRDMPSDIRDQLATVTATSPQDVTFGLDAGIEVVWGSADETQRKAVVLRAMLASVGQAVVIDVSAPETPTFR